MPESMSRSQGISASRILLIVVAASTFTASMISAAAADHLNLDRLLVEKGRYIFFNETFNGNGRTCGTCHRAEENFTLSPEFIATLPPDDPLFVAETNPALATLENPRLLREFAVIVENVDGFDDLKNKFTMRGIPHLLGMTTSVDSAAGPRTGWSGDGAPGDGSLRAFATGAVTQHFTKTLNRVPGIDFRLPTPEELDALEAFQLSLGRDRDLQLPLRLKGVVAARGQEIFLDGTLGKCNTCHFNAGANGNPAVFGPTAGNLNFNTGVEDLPDQPLRLTGELVPVDDGFGTPGDGTFNTTPLVEAADTGPFFHNNSVETIEGAVAFYNGDAFNNSPAGQVSGGINLDGTQVVAVAAFLRVINVLDNIRESDDLLNLSLLQFNDAKALELLLLAIAETDDAILVLRGGGLHPKAVASLAEAKGLTEAASESFFERGILTEMAIAKLVEARRELIDDGPLASNLP